MKALRDAIWYKLGSGGLSAPVFLDRPPDDSPRPFVVTGSALSIEPGEVIDDPERHKVATYEVLVIGNATVDAGDLDALADDVAELLDGNPSSYQPDGWRVVSATTEGPSVTDPDRESWGRSILVRLDADKTA